LIYGLIVFKITYVYKKKYDTINICWFFFRRRGLCYSSWCICHRYRFRYRGKHQDAIIF